jgi:hypothetical protein
MMDPEEKEAVLVMTAAAPQLLFTLFISYLRLKRAAVRAEKDLRRSLQANGIPRKEAKELAAAYTEWTSLRFWLRRTALPAFRDGSRSAGK